MNENTRVTTYSEKSGEITMQDPKNALSNDVVLTLIFSYFRLKDLKAVRMVCKKWCLIGAMQMRKSAMPIELTSIYKMSDFVALMSRSRHVPYDSFQFSNDQMELYSSTCQAFFQQIHVRRLRIESGMLFSSLRELLVFYTFNVEELSLSVSDEYSEARRFFLDDHRKLRNPIFPKLKSLKMDFEEMSPGFLQDFIASAPNLQNLTILQSDDFVDQTVETLKLCAGKNFAKLTLLQSNYKLGKDELENFTKFFKTNTAREILIRFQQDATGSPHLVKFFAAISDFVEYFDSPLNFEMTNFPVMHKLKNLETNQWSVLAYLPHVFPALETLVLGSKDESLTHFVLAPSSIPPFTQLSHLHLTEYDGFKLLTCEEVLTRVFSALPNVRRLCLHTVDKALPIICTHLTKLEELRLGSESLISDEGITGIPIHFCKDISHLNFPVTVVGDPKRLRFKGVPWFDNCKNLRLFHIEPPPNKAGKNSTRRNITNNSVFFGFSCMKSLTNLSIPYSEIDDDALECIGKGRHQRLIQLNITGCPHLSSKGIATLKHRRTKLRVFSTIGAVDQYEVCCDSRYVNQQRIINQVDGNNLAGIDNAGPEDNDDDDESSISSNSSSDSLPPAPSDSEFTDSDD